MAGGLEQKTMKMLIIFDPVEFIKGGPGSGNFGHAGRPGEVGGSAPAGTTAPIGGGHKDETTRAGDDTFPTAEQFRSAKWEEKNFDSAAVGIWKVTTEDGRQWFVKQNKGNIIKDEAHREQTAYLLAQTLGFSALPVQVIDRSMAPAGMVGKAGEDHLVVSPWLDEAVTLRTAWKEFLSSKKGNAEQFDDSMIRLSLFDFLIRNTDRHPGNALYDASTKQVSLIDHSYAFAERGNLSSAWAKNVSKKRTVDDSYINWLRDGLQKAEAGQKPGDSKYLEFARGQLDFIEWAYQREAASGPVAWRDLAQTLFRK